MTFAQAADIAQTLRAIDYSLFGIMIAMTLLVVVVVVNKVAGNG